MAARDWASRWCRFGCADEHRKERGRPLVSERKIKQKEASRTQGHGCRLLFDFACEERRRQARRCAAWALKTRRKFGINHLDARAAQRLVLGRRAAGSLRSRGPSLMEARAMLMPMPAYPLRLGLKLAPMHCSL